MERPVRLDRKCSFIDMSSNDLTAIVYVSVVVAAENGVLSSTKHVGLAALNSF
jgi:hypothetical protein